MEPRKPFQVLLRNSGSPTVDQQRHQVATTAMPHRHLLMNTNLTLAHVQEHRLRRASSAIKSIWGMQTIANGEKRQVAERDREPQRTTCPHEISRAAAKAVPTTRSYVRRLFRRDYLRRIQRQTNDRGETATIAPHREGPKTREIIGT